MRVRTARFAIVTALSSTWVVAAAAGCDTPTSPEASSTEHRAWGGGAVAGPGQPSPTPTLATDAPVDLQLIDTMTVHQHHGLQVARLAITKAEDPELARLARTMVDEQQRTAAALQEWREAWFPNSTAALDHPMMGPGMRGDMRQRHAGIARLADAPAAAFDRAFIDAMLQHLDRGIELAKGATTQATHSELQQLGAQLVERDTSRRQQLLAWRTPRSDEAPRGR